MRSLVQRIRDWWWPTPPWSVLISKMDFWDAGCRYMSERLAREDISPILTGELEREGFQLLKLARMVRRLARDPFSPPARRVYRPDLQPYDDVVVVEAEPWRAIVLLTEVGGQKTLLAYAVRIGWVSASEDVVTLLNRIRERRWSGP
jgi:hypothetical protein